MRPFNPPKLAKTLAGAAIVFSDPSVKYAKSKLVFKTMLADSRKPHAIAIFAAAEVTGKQKVWIVNEDASKATNVPDGV